MYIIHIAGMVLCVGKEFYVIQILELFYVEIIIFPIIFGGQTPMWSFGIYTILLTFNSTRETIFFDIHKYSLTV